MYLLDSLDFIMDLNILNHIKTSQKIQNGQIDIFSCKKILIQIQYLVRSWRWKAVLLLFATAPGDRVAFRLKLVILFAKLENKYKLDCLQTREYKLDSLQTTEYYLDSLKTTEYYLDSLQTREYNLDSLQTKEYNLDSLQTREYNLKSLQTRKNNLDSLQTTEYNWTLCNYKKNQLFAK